jgi:hypothetical protein
VPDTTYEIILYYPEVNESWRIAFWSQLDKKWYKTFKVKDKKERKIRKAFLTIANALLSQ